MVCSLVRRQMLLSSLRHAHVGSRSVVSSGRVRLPEGYYARRVVVAALGAVGSLVVYETLLAPAPQEDVMQWRDDWDNYPSASGEHEKAVAELRRRADADVDLRHIVMVRHAQCNKDGLSKEGLEQAKLTAERLKSWFGSISTIYHSGSQETQATAEILHECLGAPLVESPLLSEGVPALPSPAPVSLADIPTETLDRDQSRAEGAYRGMFWRPSGLGDGRDSVEIFVSSGNTIRYLTCRALQLPYTGWTRLAAFHCAITWLEIRPDGAVVLREFGGVGHLPPNVATYF